MKLSFEQIKEITVGAVEIWQEDNLLCFSKCRKSQVEAFENLRADLGVNAGATTGVKLDFITDSSFVECEVVNGTQYEVKVNGLLREIFYFDEDSKQRVFRVELDKSKENRVEILLPYHHYQGKIKSLELSDSAFFRRSEFNFKMLFMGDSITQGWRSKYFCSSYATLVSDYFNAECVLQGVGGGFFDEKIVDKTGFTPDVVVIAYGTNDYGRYPTFDEVEKRASDFFSKVIEEYKDAKIYYISPIWREDEKKLREMGEFWDCCKKLQTIAKKYDLTVINGANLVPHNKDYFADPIHPNDLGFHSYAFNLINELRKTIKE